MCPAPHEALPAAAAATTRNLAGFWYLKRQLARCNHLIWPSQLRVYEPNAEGFTSLQILIIISKMTMHPYSLKFMVNPSCEIEKKILVRHKAVYKTPLETSEKKEWI